MTEIYRFRPAKRLLGESPTCQELERQSIHFATPAELNDPVEALRGISWRGDSIAWTNLFKNYVFCVHRAYLDCMIGGAELDLEAHGIRVEGRWDRPESPQMTELFNEIWTQVMSDCGVGEHAERIAAFQRAVRFHEMLVYLYGVHSRALLRVATIYAERGLAPEPHGTLPTIALDRPIFPIAEVEGLVAQTNYGEEIHELLPEIVVSALDTHFLVKRYIDQREARDSTEVALRQLVFEFPRLYLQQLPELMGPKWYTASFSNTYHNPVLWANYAHSHTGACLVFETSEAGKDRSIELYSAAADQNLSGNNGRTDGTTYPLYNVHYADRLPEVDFFRNLGRLPEAVAKKLWYSDDAGNTSSCASFLQDRSQTNHWRDEHWEGYYRSVLTKTKHWSDEEEARLLIQDPEPEHSGENSRLLAYDFSSLKGIIFGIRMTEQHKMQAIEIIERKCQETGRCQFNFWQAYYSPLHGDIRRG